MSDENRGRSRDGEKGIRTPEMIGGGPLIRLVFQNPEVIALLLKAMVMDKAKIDGLRLASVQGINGILEGFHCRMHRSTKEEDYSDLPAFSSNMSLHLTNEFGNLPNHGYFTYRELQEAQGILEAQGYSVHIENNRDGTLSKQVDYLIMSVDARPGISGIPLTISSSLGFTSLADAVFDAPYSTGYRPEYSPKHLSGINVSFNQTKWPELGYTHLSVSQVQSDLQQMAKMTEDFYNAVLRVKGVVANQAIIRLTPPNLSGDSIDALFPATAPTSAEFASVILPEVVGFESVAGQDHAVRECKKFVQALNNPELLAKRGSRIPKGLLLEGPPGTGKTLLAKAIAQEANVTFVNIAASNIFTKWYGESANKLEEIFKQAEQVANEGKKVIIFVDEVETIFGARTEVHEETQRVVALMLQKLDGFGSNPNIFFVAATNNFEMLDPAMVRPGRIDKLIHVGLPSVEGLRNIFLLHAGKIKSRATEPETLFSADIDWELVASTAAAAKYSGADVENSLNRLLEEKSFTELEGVSWTSVTTEEIIASIGQYKPEKERRDEIKRPIGFRTTQETGV